jgi:hypothetical protein
MSKLIIRLAVEEEARIMLLVIQIAKEESKDSIKIMQRHNWIVDFLKYILGKIETKVNQGYQHQQQ